MNYTLQKAESLCECHASAGDRLRKVKAAHYLEQVKKKETRLSVTFEYLETSRRALWALPFTTLENKIY